MKNIFIFSLGALSCLILSTTFSKKQEPDKIYAHNKLSNILFSNCSNEISVEAPAEADLSFTAVNAQLIRGAQRNVVMLVPNTADTTVTLKMSYNGKTYSQTYNSIACPAPEIELVCNGKPIDFKLGMAAPGPRQIVIHASASPFFKKMYTVDSRFVVAEWNAIIVRGKRPVAQQRFLTSAGNVTAFQSSAVSGDRMLIEITKIQRINFMGKREDITYDNLHYNLPLY